MPEIEKIEIGKYRYVNEEKVTISQAIIDFNDKTVTFEISGKKESVKFWELKDSHVFDMGFENMKEFKNLLQVCFIEAKLDGVF